MNHRAARLVIGVVLGSTAFACGGSLHGESEPVDAGKENSAPAPAPNDAGLPGPSTPLPNFSCPAPPDGGPPACDRTASFPADLVTPIAGVLPARLATDQCEVELRLDVDDDGAPALCARARADLYASGGLREGGFDGPLVPSAVVQGAHESCLRKQPFGVDIRVGIDVLRCGGGGASGELRVRFDGEAGAAKHWQLAGGFDTSSGGARCAAPDTLVATPSGEREMQALREGDLVYSTSPDGFVVVPLVAIRRVPVTSHKVVRVELPSGRAVEMSAAHPLADGRSFRDLLADPRIDGTSPIRSTVVAHRYPFTMDILPNSRSGTYVASGIVVGSTLTRQR